jgi:hypothetical protein
MGGKAGGRAGRRETHMTSVKLCVTQQSMHFALTKMRAGSESFLLPFNELSALLMRVLDRVPETLSQVTNNSHEYFKCSYQQSNSEYPLNQARSTFHVLQATWPKFRLHATKMKFNTQNE